MRRLLLVLALTGCRMPETIGNDPAANPPPRDAGSSALPQRTHVEVLLDALRSGTIQYATMRPPGSPFISLGRRMLVVAPPDAVELSHTGDVRVLDALVPLLLDEKRAFAAEVVLRAMMGDEPLGLGDPAGWWSAQGKNAHEYWVKRLAEVRNGLVWNPTENRFERARASDAG